MNKILQLTKHQSPVESCERPKSYGGRATGRVSKRQWLDAALEVLASDGVDAVRIASLARTLNISKSGFYWHFKNRDDLLAEMRSYWIDEFSQQIIDEFDKQIISEVPYQDYLLRERLLTLVWTIRKKQSGKYDLAFTSWAQRDPLVRELVDRVRDMRATFVKRLLAHSGCTGDELESRARLFVVYFSWSEVMFKQTAAGLEGEPLDDILKIIAGPAGN